MRGLTYYLLPPPPQLRIKQSSVILPTNSLVLQDYQQLPDRPQFNQESKKGTWNDTRAFSQDSKNAQEDDYDQPAAIAVKNKELNSSGGKGQSVLFDDLTYQVASAPV